MNERSNISVVPKSKAYIIAPQMAEITRHIRTGVDTAHFAMPVGMSVIAITALINTGVAVKNSVSLAK